MCSLSSPAHKKHARVGENSVTLSMRRAVHDAWYHQNTALGTRLAPVRATMTTWNGCALALTAALARLVGLGSSLIPPERHVTAMILSVMGSVSESGCRYTFLEDVRYTVVKM